MKQLTTMKEIDLIRYAWYELIERISYTEKKFVENPQSIYIKERINILNAQECELHDLLLELEAQEN